MSLREVYEKMAYWFYWLALPAGGLHELGHYGVARLLGLETQWGWFTTRFQSRGKIRAMLVLLAPGLAGLIAAVALVGAFLIERPSGATWFLTGIAFMFWELSCLGDFFSVYQLLVRGQAPDYAAGLNTRGYVPASFLLRQMKNKD